MDTLDLTNHYDVVVIGAGFSGLYATWRLRESGYDVHSYEASEHIGGVWTWNRYPGARTDSLQETYQFSFDKDFYLSWKYSDIHPTQPEVLAYLNYFADYFDLRPLYSMGTRVTSAHWDESSNRWVFTTDTGEISTAKYFVTGLGLVSAPLIPDTPGFDSFKGELYHTSRWPEGGVDFAGKRVAVIGTGSSGVQLAPEIADVAAELTVFQRTPNWVAPDGHRPVTEEEREQLAQDFDSLWALVRQHPAGWPWSETGRSVWDYSPAERDEIFEKAWKDGGFSLLFQAFDDVSLSKEANDILCDFFARKIRETVKDPAVAESLTPDHPYGAKRPPASGRYLEMYNKDHVHLVDLKKTPIQRYTPEGIATSAAHMEFDVIILATGFDAITGAFTRMDIRGLNGLSLADTWNNEGPKTFLGLAINQFPNLLMVAGPQSPFSNLPPGAQAAGDWIAEYLAFVETNGIEVFQPTQGAQETWNQHVQDVALAGLTSYGKEANSWAVGANVPGKPQVYNVYYGGFKEYVDRCDAEAAAGYPNMVALDVHQRVGQPSKS